MSSSRDRQNRHFNPEFEQAAPKGMRSLTFLYLLATIGFIPVLMIVIGGVAAYRAEDWGWQRGLGALAIILGLLLSLWFWRASSDSTSGRKN